MTDRQEKLEIRTGNSWMHLIVLVEETTYLSYNGR